MGSHSDRLRSLSGLAAIGLFGASIVVAQSGGGEEEEGLLSCSHVALCASAAAVPCDAGASVSCCRNGPSGTWACKCCDTDFDCVNTPSPWQCNDVVAGGDPGSEN